MASHPTPSSNQPRSSFFKKLGPTELGLLTAYTVFLILGCALIPAFDLDEALYLSVADHMKQSGDWLSMQWNGSPLFHKPPFFYWLIALSSLCIDGAAAPVSTFAARIPTALASLSIFFALLRAQANFGRRPTFGFLLFTAPLITAGAILFDPIQSLLLVLFFLASESWLKEGQIPAAGRALVLSALIACAALFKGLNGFFIPLGYALLMSIFHFTIRQARSLIVVFGAAALLTAAGYLWLDGTLGRAFTEEFFLVHHFGRASNAMEGHSGAWYYFPLVFILGCGPGLYFLRQFTRSQAVWVASVIGFFFFSKTSLPHYVWPAWPIAALALGESQIHESRFKFAAILPTLLGAFAVFLAVPTGTEMLISVTSSASAQAILNARPELSTVQQSLLFVGGALQVLIAVLMLAGRAGIQKVAVLQLISLGMIFFTGAKHYDDWTQAPLRRLAESAQQSAGADGCIRYVGPTSAVFAAALKEGKNVNTCATADAQALIVPDWKSKECEEFSLTRTLHDSYFWLCLKP
jgi:4-amino-4-deoxy-L-arabinose transferase-like glycosyltransferase